MDMASLNKVLLIGNLGRDPEVRYSADGNPVANISLATTDIWKDKATGEKKESTEWHRVVFFKRLAEIVGEYLKKGSQIYVEGFIRTRKWTDKDNNERYTTEIVANEMKILGPRNLANEKLAKSDDDSPPAPERPSSKADDFHDDVPF